MRSNKGKATRFLLRRNLFIGVIVFLVAFYMMPFWALSSIPQVKREIAEFYLPEDIEGITARLTPIVSSNVMTLQVNLETMVALYGGLGFLTAMMLMRHLFSRRQSMLYAALPDRREMDYLRRCAGYAVLCLAPICINFLLYLLVIAAHGLLGYVVWDTLLPKFYLLLLINLYGFAMGMLASVLTGTYWAALLSGAVLILGAEALAALWYWLSGLYLYTLIRASFMDALLHCSPAYSLYKGFYKPEEFVWLPGIAAIAAALALSFVLYRIRRTERAERTLAFAPLHSILGFLLPLIGGTFMGIVIKLSFESEISLVAGMALGAGLTFWVCRMVFNQRFCGMGRQWYLPIASAAALALGVVVLHTDMLGYDRFLPDKAELTAITYRPQGYDPDEIVTLTSADAMDAAYEWCTMMQREVAGYEDGLIGDNAVFRGSDVVVTYQMGEREVKRHYPNGTIRTDAQDILRRVIESEDYRRSLIGEYHLNDGTVYSLYLNPVSRALQENEIYDRFNILRTHRSYGRAEDGKMMDEWLGALEKDILSRTFEEKMEEAIFHVDMFFRNPDNRGTGYRTIKVYPGDTHFLQAVFGEKAAGIVDYATGGYAEDEDMVVIRLEADQSEAQFSEAGLNFREAVSKAALASSADEAAAWIRQSQSVSSDQYYFKPYRTDEPVRRLYIYQMSEVERYADTFGYEVPADKAELYLDLNIPTWLTLDYMGER